VAISSISQSFDLPPLQARSHGCQDLIGYLGGVRSDAQQILKFLVLVGSPRPQFRLLGFKEIPNRAAILTMLAGDRFISPAIARTDFEAPASWIKYRSSA
jgi:hypothetical protein